MLCFKRPILLPLLKKYILETTNNSIQKIIDNHKVSTNIFNLSTEENIQITEIKKYPNIQGILFFISLSSFIYFYKNK